MRNVGFFLTSAAFASLALPATASIITLAPAGIVTSLTQCEVQSCGTYPPNLGYNGNLSGYAGTQTVGEGSYVTASGFPFPTLTSAVPLGGANAIIDAELTYVLEVVPVDGGTTPAPVLLGVSAVGSDSVTTSGGPLGSNDANSLIQLMLESDSSGDTVFNDSVDIDYTAGNSSSCSTQNNSSVSGAGVLSSVSVGCGGSSGSGGFTESGSYTISTNTPYLVVMQANVTVGTSNDGLANGGGTVQGTAYVDPMFSIPFDFRLDLSPGVGNGVPDMPEPATWMMAITGLGLAALMKRKSLRGVIKVGAINGGR